jgi:hypothetical protein
MSERRAVTGRMVPFDSARRASLRAPFDSASLPLGESNGGGGGSRTRVREYPTVGIYMRVPFC